MKRRGMLSWLTLFLVGLLVSVSCTPSNAPGGAPGGTMVRMGFSAWPGWLPWQVTQEAQIFEKYQVQVDLKWFDGYLDSIKALTAGQLDANTQTLNDTISSVAAGSDQVIVLVNDNSTGNDQIIVREGIATIADLKDKTIGAEEGTVDHYLLLLGLQKAGLTQADINFQPLETGAAAAAFAAGQLDAVGAFAPFTTQALKRSGSQVLFSSKDFPGAIPDHLVFSRQFVEEHPEVVQGMVNSWFDTLDYIQANRNQAYEIMAKRAGVSVEDYQTYDEGTHIFTLEENLQAFQDGPDRIHLPFVAKEISQFLLDSQLISQEPDLSRLFDDRFVKAAVARKKD